MEDELEEEVSIDEEVVDEESDVVVVVRLEVVEEVVI